ncbi:hypothetical protein EPA93_39435 [Ktedonosporobacter rubrisoli]|uniref:Pentapeptide repeat-containing protein n=1 Tax=Ktedonosporobacter rubrisoli TaxID=2509675 RepID=A0A4P6K7W0_KTERU|nr:hypothetical protein EPA93_39435 [Ktedonosporobacter rubrisoli]
MCNAIFKGSNLVASKASQANFTGATMEYSHLWHFHLLL